MKALWSAYQHGEQHLIVSKHDDVTFGFHVRLSAAIFTRSIMEESISKVKVNTFSDFSSKNVMA
jgi:hypothetical protein